MRIIGTTYGDPHSADTYSGVPFHLFAELERKNCLVGRMNADIRKPIDVLRNRIDWRQTFRTRRPRSNAYWRYLPESISTLSRRFERELSKQNPHDTVLQIGVAGVPPKSVTFAAHVEISIGTAASLPIFSQSYGFARGAGKFLELAKAGERQFLERADLIWTNTNWTAETFSDYDIPATKLWVHPPACNAADPGPIAREWSEPRILFIGKDWQRKGGPVTVQAFRLLRDRFPKATLTIIGCNPDLREPGIRVLGFLDKRIPAESQVIDRACRESTVFCMPSTWESVGLVYMEAALYGLPVIMLRGQRREEIFPQSMAIHLATHDIAELHNALEMLADTPSLASQMGLAGRKHILENYTWETVAQRLINRITAIRSK